MTEKCQWMSIGCKSVKYKRSQDPGRQKRDALKAGRGATFLELPQTPLQISNDKAAERRPQIRFCSQLQPSDRRCLSNMVPQTQTPPTMEAKNTNRQRQTKHACHAASKSANATKLCQHALFASVCSGHATTATTRLRLAAMTSMLCG